MMFLLTQVYSITLKAAFPVWEGNMMPVQLHLLFSTDVSSSSAAVAEG